MNPVLLKPQSEIGAQVVVQGRVHGTADARAYQAMKPTLLPFVLDSFARLKARGRPRAGRRAPAARRRSTSAPNDIANMGFRPRAAASPVVLIGDIDRGGVIASLVGTKAVLDPADAALIRGFIVNKFRGDPALFADGMARSPPAPAGRRSASSRTFPRRAPLPAEDALALDEPRRKREPAASASPSRSCRTSPISTISTRSTPSPRSISCACEPGRRCPAMPISSSCRARRRPSPTSPRCARRLGHRHRGPSSPRRRACSASAAATRCSAARSPTPRASKARGERPRASACSTSRPSSSAEKRLEPVERPHADGRPFAATRCIWAHRRPRLRAPVRAPRRRSPRGRGLGRRARHRHLRPRPVRRRPPARGLAGAPRRRRLDDRLRGRGRGGARRARGATSQPTSTSTGCSRWRADAARTAPPWRSAARRRAQ